MTITGPADNCGSCLTADCAVSVTPYAVVPAGDDAIRAWYRCPGCGHGWFTSWLLSTAGAA